MDGINQNIAVTGTPDMTQPDWLKKVPLYVGGGIGVSVGIAQACDVLVKVNPDKGFDKSIIGRLTNAIDRIVCTPTGKSIHKHLESKTAKLNERIQTIINNKKEYKDVVELFKSGGKSEAAGALANSAADNAGKEVVEAAKNKSTISKFLSTGLENPVSGNIGKEALVAVKNKSIISRFLTKGIVEVGNCFGAGNLAGMLLSGAILALSVKTADDAPKGEKFSTFMEELIGGWIGTMIFWNPVSKNIERVANLRQPIPKDSPFWRKAVRTIGRIVGSGMDIHAKDFKPESIFKGSGDLSFKEKLSKIFTKEMRGPIGNYLKKLPKYLWKGSLKGPGFLLRLGLTFLLLVPFSNVFKGISHIFFGKPSHKNENINENSNTGANNNGIADNNAAINGTSYNNPSDNRVQNMFNTIQNSNNQGSFSQLPTQEMSAQNQMPTYLPSTDPVKISTTNSNQSDKISQALKNADETEKMVQEVLKNLH